MAWGKVTNPAPNDFVNGPEMCAWKYIIHTEDIHPDDSIDIGILYSGRLKYNMLCWSVIMGPKPRWLEFWTHLIVPGFNYVEVYRNWTNLCLHPCRSSTPPKLP